MKKMFIGLLSLLLCLPFFTFSNSAFAASEADFNWTDNGDGTATITGYIGTDTDLVIPSQLSGLTVTKIGDSAFRNKQLTNVMIPSSVTSIGNSAFDSNKFTNLSIPDGVTTIGSSAFSNNNLASVTIPNSVTTIKVSAFANNQLTSVTIPNSITKIEANTFMNNKLTSVNIPSSVTIIKTYAFSTNRLTDITIPDSVTTIEISAFEYNQISSVVIPKNVTSVGLSAFLSNPITSATFLNASTVIDNSAFTSSSMTVKGYDPSTAKDYAVTKGYTFEEIRPTTDTTDLSLIGGDLSVSVPTISRFGNIVLKTQPKTYLASFASPINVRDLTGTQQGWRLDVSAQPFTVVTPEGGFAPGTSAFKLPNGSLSLTPLTKIERVGTGQGELPVNNLSSQTILDDGPVTVASAAPGTGMGEFNLTFPIDALSLTVDATTARTDIVNYSKDLTPYESTLTWNLVSAP